LRKQCRKFIVEEFSKRLDDKLKTIGLTGYTLYPLIDEGGKVIDSDVDPTVLMLEYPTISDEGSSYVKPAVKIEISCLSMEEPFELKNITTMISNRFPKDDVDTNAVIPTVLPTRTFLEKAFLLCEEFQKTEPRSHRMSRHLYDLDRLTGTSFVSDALADRELYIKVVEHRRKFYHVGYADYDKDYPDKIEFYPPSHCMKAWENDYTELLEGFVYGDKKTFAELLAKIRELEQMFRQSNKR
jgi:hypothetical protein